MKYAKKSLWHFVCFSALGAYLRGVFSSTPYINQEVNHQAAVYSNGNLWLCGKYKKFTGVKKGVKNWWWLNFSRALV